MKREESEKIVFLTLIAERDNREVLLNALSESGIHLVNTSFGRGFVESDYLKHTFGLDKEARKVIFTCVSTRTKVDNILERLTDEFDFNDPDTGIAFTIPIEKLAY